MEQKREVASPQLQWDRTSEGAEILFVRNRSVNNSGRLQWDRTSEGAEIKFFQTLPAVSCCFNGTAPRKVRKSDVLCDEPLRDVGLQWDRTSEGAEISKSWTFCCCCCMLQWDRTSEGAEILPLGKCDACRRFFSKCESLFKSS